MNDYRITIALLVTAAVLGMNNAKADKVALDNGWLFRPDPTNQGHTSGWFSLKNPETEGFKPIQVGQSWESQGYPYDGYAWYRCEFQLPEAAKGSTLTLRFEAVDEEADIWLNEMFVDTVAVGWNNPFELDITDYAVYDCANVLAVRVLDTARQGGIWKPVTLTYTEVNPQALPEYVRRFRRESVRALSAPVGHPAQAQRYVNAGFNLCLSWAYMLREAQPFTPYPGQDYIHRDCIADTHIQRYYAEAQTAKEHKLLYMPNLWLHNDTLPFMVDRDYRRCVDFYGRKLSLTHCPQSENFWQKLILPQMKILAEIQREVGCDGGICLDLEWYAGDFSGGFCYDPLAVQGCYCDTCFAGFMQSLGEQADAVPKEYRGEFIRSRGELEAYWLYLETQVARQIRRICTEIRTIKNDLLFGMLPGVAGARYAGGENWFTRGAVRGMSMDGIPVLIFSETEYETGWCQRTAQQLEWLNRTGVPGLLVGGLTIGHFSGQGLGAKAAELAQRADGYWLYHGASLASAQTPIRTERSQQSAHTLREPMVRYWDALTRANGWLDKQIELPILNRFESQTFLSSEIVKQASDGIIISQHALTFASSGSAPTNLLINGDFKQPLDVAWISFDAQGIVGADGEYGNQLLYDFSQRPDDQGFSSCFQTLRLEPDSTYELTTHVRIQELQGLRRVGVHVCHYNSPQVILNLVLPLDAADNVTHKLNGQFTTGADGKINVVLLANGRYGQIVFGQTTLLPVEVKTLVTQPLAKLNAVVIPKAEMVSTQWNLLEPASGVRYFGALSEAVDLRYLNILYPECAYQIELAATVPVTPQAIEISLPFMVTQ